MLASSIPLSPSQCVPALATPGRRHRLADAMAVGAKASSTVLNKDTVEQLNRLVELNMNYLETVTTKVASGEMSKDQGQRIASLITENMQELEAKAKAYQAAITESERRRRRRGFFGFLNKLVKGGGRVLGKVIGGVMYGTGRVLKYAIEEAAPRIIMDKVKALLRAKIDELIEKLEGRIGPLATDILVKVARDLSRRRSAGRPRPSQEEPEEGKLIFTASESHFGHYLCNHMVYEDFLELFGDDYWSPQSVLAVWTTSAGVRNVTLNSEEWLGGERRASFCSKIRDLTFTMTIDTEDGTFTGTFKGEARSPPPASALYCGVIFSDDMKTLVDRHPNIGLSMDIARRALGTFEGKFRGTVWQWSSEAANFTGDVDVHLTFERASFLIGSVGWDPPELIDGWGPDELQGAYVSGISYFMQNTAPVTIDLKGKIKGTRKYIYVVCGDELATFNMFCNETGASLIFGSPT